MTDLEKLINELCELPSCDLEGLEDTIVVQWASSGKGDRAFVKIGEWESNIYLDPIQALILSAWLNNQAENLVSLRDALQAKHIQEEATREQRAAERLNALKVKHSEAVTAWQEGGCVGPCPSFDEIANPKVEFIRKYPCWELLMKERRG